MSNTLRSSPSKSCHLGWYALSGLAGLVILPYCARRLFGKKTCGLPAAAAAAATEAVGQATPQDRVGVLMKGWFSEVNSQWPGQAMSLQVEKVLMRKKSQFQDILVFDSATWGRVLVLDGAIQFTEKDEMSYQEMLAHLPMFLHAHPKDVLIIGGGDGGVAREVLKHNSVERVTLCDIDECVVETSKQFFPSMSASFDDKRLNVVIGDGIAFVRSAELTEQFDVVIIDSSDPEGPAAGLFNKEFLQNVHRLLRPNGVVCQQSESLWLDLKLINYMKFASASLFSSLEYASIQVPTYPCGQIGALVGVKGSAPRDLAKPVRAVPTDMKLRFYTSKLHEASFAVPQFVHDALSQSLPVDDDVIAMKKEISDIQLSL